MHLYGTPNLVFYPNDCSMAVMLNTACSKPNTQCPYSFQGIKKYFKGLPGGQTWDNIPLINIDGVFVCSVAIGVNNIHSSNHCVCVKKTDDVINVYDPDFELGHPILFSQSHLLNIIGLKNIYLMYNKR